MNKTNYIKFRRELLELMDEALSVADITVDSRTELQSAKQILLEDSFEIVLVGEFQGGKSTTFNALCDGREISPRGALIKTSACRISAHNLAKHEEAEYARVTWKTDIELLKTIIDLVAPGIRQAQPRRFPENIPNAVMIGEISPHEISGLPKEFRPLTFAKDVGLLKSVLNDEWQEFQENPVAYDKISAGRQDMLYIATLIVDHCASRVIKGHSSRQSEEMAIEEMAKYVRFPANWESRWSNYSPSSFSDEEVLFAFVARVDCFIHSENLGKLGCVVTDCPGLFASDWDTRVATDAMKSAHAIAYLFGGERALSSQELVALQHIRSLGLEDNLFYVFNAHTRIGQAKDTIVPADESILRNQGYRLGNGGINIYHALLGLCSRNLLQIDSDADGFSQRRFCDLSARIYEGEQFATAKETWARVVDDNLYHYLDRNEHGKIPGLIKNPDQIGMCSGFDSIIDKIEHFVLEKRARALLVDRGANRVMAALNSALKTLNDVKADAVKDAADAFAECTSAETSFNKFQAEARKIVEEQILKGGVGLPLINEFVDDVFVRCGGEIADRVAGELAEDIASNKAKYIKEATLSRQPSTFIRGRVEACFRKHFEKVIGTAVEAWVLNIKDGKNKTFNEEFGYVVSRTSRLLHEKWDEIKEILPPAVAARLGGFDFLPVEMNDAATSFAGGHDATELLGRMSFVFLASAVCPMVVAGIVYSVIIAIVVNTLTGFIPILIGLIVAVVATFFAATTVHSVIVEKLKNVILEKLKGTVTTSFQQPEVAVKIKEGARKIINSLKAACADMFRNALDRQRDAFQERIEKTRAISRTSQEILNKQIAHYNDVIANQLNPLLGKVETFISNCDRVK